MNKTKWSIVAALSVAALATTSPAEARCKGSGLTDFLGDLAGIAADKYIPGIGRYKFAKAFAEVFACLTDGEREQSRQAEMDSLNSGQSGNNSRREWRGNDYSGGSEVATRNGQCAVTRTFVTDERGKEVSLYRRRCQKPDGSWDEGTPVESP